MNMNHQNHMYELCKSHIHAYVLVETTEGEQVDGIITGLDDDHVYMAVPESGMSSPGDDMMRDDRQFGYGHGGYGGGYGGYPGYGYGPGYGHGGYGYGHGYGRRPFRRLILPLAALTALSVLPWY